ncbi:acetate/propionate family kinase [Arthrobacter monumenti]
MLVLVLNSGSSSIKYQVREVPPPGADDNQEAILTEGIVERIGEGEVENHTAALEQINSGLSEALGDRQIDAVGHRVVHGGERFGEPVLITNEITRAIERLNPLAPLHNPPNVLGIRAIADKWPDLPQVAVFDTAFHRTLPERAWRYAIPDDFYRKYGIRRYGFHGTSCEYVTQQAAELLECPLGEFNAVVAHLGNGASATAIQGGISVDTSMGFTPLEGLVMGTRSGDLDPSILLFLEREGFSADELDEILNKQSGLKALFGQNDMRAIVEAGDDERAGLTLDISSYRLAKYIGGYHVAVGGARAIVFTAGIGENSPQFRQAVVARLAPLGVKLDDGANLGPAGGARIISTEDSAIQVLVVPTDEERAIAGATAAVVNHRAGGKDS